MSAVARYFKSQGAEVSGYDKTPTHLTEQLEREGIPVTFEDDVNTLPKDVDLVVYTPAMPKEVASIALNLMTPTFPPFFFNSSASVLPM